MMLFKNNRGGVKHSSTSKKAKSLIRGEIKSFYGPSATGEKISSIKAMKRDADAYNADQPRNSRWKPSDYQKAALWWMLEASDVITPIKVNSCQKSTAKRMLTSGQAIRSITLTLI